MAEKRKERARERVWTETELKYLAFVLADEADNFSFRLDTLALKKSSDNELFEEISKVFESSLSSQEFKEQNEHERRKSKRKRNDTPLDITAGRLRVKYKWLRNQWRKFTDRVKKGSGKAPIEAPEWFIILNPIFSDTMGDLDVASRPSHVLSRESDCSSSDEETEHDQTDTASTSNQDNGAELDIDNLLDESSGADSSSAGTKGRIQKPQLQVKTCFKKKVKSQTQAIHEIAKSFGTLGDMQ